MMSAKPSEPREQSTLDRVLGELTALDAAVSAAVTTTSSPTVDVVLGRVSNAANRSRLWLATAGVLSLLGPRPRRAAATGLAAIGVTSAVVNLGIKPLLRRQRPLRDEILGHSVLMPRSHAFPSGHAASAFAFASAVGAEIPALATPLRVMATTVAYSRMHAGVHFGGDVVVGALVGAGVGTAVRQAAERRR
jgi:membrane-associated phospholipid phosphatase